MAVERLKHLALLAPEEDVGYLKTSNTLETTVPDQLLIMLMSRILG